jgi:hypothetical protein
MRTIALVYMADPKENFFIEDCPKGDPQKWIGSYVNNVGDVEHVMVYEMGNMKTSWANPNSSEE